MLRPMRRTLPRKFAVRTSLTFTSNSDWTAFLISILLADGCTMNVYLPTSSAIAVERSVTTGRMMTSRGSRMRHLRSPLESRRFNDHGVRPQYVVRRLLPERPHFHALDVARGQVHHRVMTVGQNQDIAFGARRLEQRGNVLGLRQIQLDRLDQNDAAVLRTRIERRAPGQPPNLLGQVLVIVASGTRTEDDAAPAPRRRASRALPRAAGALLPPRLLVAARNFGPGLGRRIRLPLVGEERFHRLVHRWLVHFAIEQNLRQLALTRLVSGG